MIGAQLHIFRVRKGSNGIDGRVITSLLQATIHDQTSLYKRKVHQSDHNDQPSAAPFPFVCPHPEDGLLLLPQPPAAGPAVTPLTPLTAAAPHPEGS